MEKETHVSISCGNSKMGAIPSVSLPPLITCNTEACKYCGKKMLCRQDCPSTKICQRRL